MVGGGEGGGWVKMSATMAPWLVDNEELNRSTGKNALEQSLKHEIIF